MFPTPKPQLRAAAGASDPLGALLQEQGLIGSPANVPVAIGLGLSETAKTSRFTLEFSDPVDVQPVAMGFEDLWLVLS